MRARKLALLLGALLGCGNADPSPGPADPVSSARPPSTAEPIAPAPPEAPSAAPESAEPLPSLLSAEDAARVDAAVKGAIERREIPGAVVLVIAGDRTVFHRAYGLRAREPAALPMTLDTLFDLASLSKPIATATSIALLAERGRLRFADPAARHLPDFAAQGKGAVTIEQLLLHTSGLIADNPLSDYEGDRTTAMRRLSALAPETPPGAAFRYSDVGYLVLGEIVERASSAKLDGFAREGLFDPLGMSDTTFAPPPPLAARAAPTEKSGEVFLIGKVHDPRARALGGVAGHAGLFATAADLGQYARMLLGGGALSGRRVLAAETVRALLAPHEIPGGKRAYLGAVNGTAVSHTGFTGTQLWLDAQRRIAVIVLSNRVHPDGKGSADRLRREVIEASVAGAMTAKTKSFVQPGVDALEEGGFAELRGHKVALLTHAAGRTLSGRSTIDALRSAPGVTLVSLLSPEHGLRSSEDGAVADEKDARSGLRVHSLYGSSKRPTKAMLEGADTIAVDLQDAGARFYTYETTLGYALEAAAQLGVRVVVLDRPNPLGDKIEGPLLDPGRESFVAYDRVPVRHGMTLGELARMWNSERKIGCDLTVVPMKGWKRAALFSETGLAWTPPSPNLRSATAALLYPGVGLIELTNVSVGRGTDRPFEQIGAPWIDGEKLAAALRQMSLPGVAVSPVSFTPKASRFAGELCHGVAFSVTAPNELSSVRLGIALAVALVKVHGLGWRAASLLTLLGHERAFERILAGDEVDAVLATFQKETSAFAARRKPYLLY